jgi:hypothetical protein
MKYVTKRSSIVNALVEKFKTIDGTGPFSVDVTGNVHAKMEFWDTVQDFPAIFVVAGNETRQPQAGGYFDRTLAVTVRCYVKDEEPIAVLEGLLADIEFIIEENGRLAYQDRSGTPGTTHDILILSIDTDEGVLDPLGVGEILLQVRY